MPPGSNLFVFSDGAYQITQPDGEMWSHDEFAEFLRGFDPGKGLVELDGVETQDPRHARRAGFRRRRLGVAGEVRVGAAFGAAAGNPGSEDPGLLGKALR